MATNSLLFFIFRRPEKGFSSDSKVFQNPQNLGIIKSYYLVVYFQVKYRITLGFDEVNGQYFHVFDN